MDVYWSKQYPNNIYIHVGPEDLRVITPVGRMERTIWFDLSYFTADELEHFGFELIGAIEPEGE